MLAVLIYFGYALDRLAGRDGDDEDGPPIHGNTRIQATWIAGPRRSCSSSPCSAPSSSSDPRPARAPAEGPQPIWTPGRTTCSRSRSSASSGVDVPLPAVRRDRDHPAELPVDQPVQFNVTSLDVIHSFWAYQLGVKADANPGVNNVAYTTAKQHRQRSPSAAPSCAACGTARCSTTGRSSPRPPSRPGRSDTRHAAGARLTRPPAALRADLRPHRDPAARQGPDQAGGVTGAGGGYYSPGTRRRRDAPEATAHLKSATDVSEG